MRVDRAGWGRRPPGACQLLNPRGRGDGQWTAIGRPGRDRDDEIERDGDTQSTPLYGWDRGGQGSHAYGGYGEAGPDPRGDRYGGDRFAGRERTERSHYSARHPRDFASDDRHRDYRSRSRDDYDRASRDEADDRSRRERADRDRARFGTWMSYADPYGFPTYIPYASADFGRSTYDRGGYAPSDHNQRGFFERAGDEVLSWFGDEEAQRRRDRDHRGRGPTDYVRSDDRIREDVNDRLTDDYWVDASRIGVVVSAGEVTLDGTVDSKSDKRRAEDLADAVSGVKHVQNNLRVDSSSFAPQGS